MGVAMRGHDGIFGSFFSYIDLGKRVRSDHPLRVIREIANVAPAALSGEFAGCTRRLAGARCRRSD
jgi:hypothetical protein